MSSDEKGKAKRTPFNYGSYLQVKRSHKLNNCSFYNNVYVNQY